MLGQEFRHSKASDFLLAENLGHFSVRSEILFVFWVLQLVLLNVGPQVLNDLAPGGVGSAHYGCQIGGERVGLGQTFTLRHLVD